MAILWTIPGFAQDSLQIVTLSPPQYDLDVPASSNIIVTFNADINETTINENTFVVNGAMTGRTPGMVSYNDIQKTATFYPSADFAVGEVVLVSLSSAIMSLDGANLENGFTWSFTIGVSNESPGTFFLDSIYRLGGSYPVSVQAVNINGDAYLDIVLVCQYADSIKYFLNNGEGKFTEQHGFWIGLNPVSVFPADLDGDNNIDLAVANVESDNLVVLLNDGMSGFIRDTSYITGDGAHFVCGGDFDADTDIDLAVINSLSNNIAILSNDGSGAFVISSTFATDIDPQSICAADLDNDGDIDLANSNNGSGTITVYHNEGGGTFSTPSTYPIGNSPRIIMAADLDGDGDADLACANNHFDYNSISILKNNGDGTFADHIEYNAGSHPFCVSGGDLDGDGDIDLLTGSWGTNGLQIHFNDGSGVFDSTIGIRNGGYNSIFAADLTGTGTLDLAVTYVNALHNLSIFYNREYRCVDSDEDGFGDPGYPDNECELDNCPYAYNPSQEDFDSDGMGDSCDTDYDGDDVDNSIDNCLFLFNPDQADSNGDGIGDACDYDLDWDGVPNEEDNCVLEYNPDQTDLDKNNQGDSCDVDMDGDGLTNDIDNCVYNFNPDQADSNSDGTGDVCDMPMQVGMRVAEFDQTAIVDTLYVGGEYEFQILIENEPFVSMLLYFRIWSDDGTVWSWISRAGGNMYFYDGIAAVTDVEGSRIYPMNDVFEDRAEVKEYSFDGISPDTLNINGVSWFGLGMPPGRLEHVLSIHFTVSHITDPDGVGTICIDTVYSPPFERVWFETHYPTPSLIPNILIPEGGLCLPVTYVCGDANSDAETNIGDAVFIINYVFNNGDAPAQPQAADANCDGDINVGDAVYLIAYVFKGGPEPCCP